MKKKTQKKKEKQESYLNVIVRREKNIKKIRSIIIRNMPSIIDVCTIEKLKINILIFSSIFMSTMSN
jgi:hypothetical protein